MEDKVRIPLWLQFLLLFSSIFLLLKNIIGVRRRSNKLPPPGPPKLPIIGNLHQLGSLPHRSLHRLSEKHGPVMLLQLGSVPTLIVSSAETAKQVLKTNDIECRTRPLLAATERLSYNYLDLAFCPYGNYWREMKKIFSLKLFSVNRVQSFRFIREEEVAAMITSISQSSFSRNPVNVSKMLMSLTMEITCRVAFGKSFGDHGGFDVHKFQGLIQDAVEILGVFSASDFFPCVGWMIDRITGFHGRLERIFHDFDIFFQKALDDRLLLGRQKEEDQQDILDVLLKLQEDEAQPSAIQITHNHIKAVLMNIFLAGVETTTTAMEWAMAELAKNPRVMKKAQQEIRNYIGRKGKISESDINQLQYLKLVVKEALRLHPPGSLLLPRESLSDFNINGFNICPKTRIHVNAWAIGRDPESWENPEQFYPERFMDSNSSIDYKGQHFELLPFGAGRRRCPGMYIAVLNVELALANLLYHFDWKLPDGMKEEDLNMEEVMGLTSHRKEDLLLLPTKYE